MCSPQKSRRATGIGIHECLKNNQDFSSSLLALDTPACIIICTAKKPTKPTTEGAAHRLLTPQTFSSSPFSRARPNPRLLFLPPPGPISAARQPWKTSASCARRRWSGWRTDRAGTATCAPPASPASVS